MKETTLNSSGKIFANKKQFAVAAAQFVYGTLLFIFGLNGFLNFIPMPTPPQEAMNFLQALTNSGYLMYLIKGMEVVIGLCLIFNQFVPLALILYAPVAVNILLFHAFLAPMGLPLAILVVGFNFGLMMVYRNHYRLIWHNNTLH